jgi:hypothetical protein
LRGAGFSGNTGFSSQSGCRAARHLNVSSRRLTDYSPNPESGDSPPYGAGLLRAAIADFLFNYKMSQQYPHEFVPYDLSHSADALNNALSPLIDAFNRDLWSYQLFVRADMQYRVERLNSRTDERCCVKRLFGLDKPRSSTTAWSPSALFPDSRPVSARLRRAFLMAAQRLNFRSAQFASWDQGGKPCNNRCQRDYYHDHNHHDHHGRCANSGSLRWGSPRYYPRKDHRGRLANYQTTFAQIGRQLSFSATPAKPQRPRRRRKLQSRSMPMNRRAAPSTPGPARTDPAFNTSRVANHDTTTRVRVDSIKLFEVSSFSAIVERSRSRFPLLPPFVEIPYIGTFAGIPLGSAKEFHSSTAIISAYVVPTAADIAYGLRFVSDLVVDGLNPAGAVSLKELPDRMSRMPASSARCPLAARFWYTTHSRVQPEE